ncbi:GNAT family N-acetyltransferase [Algicella marina]|uniref:GNAT family N-acetyltransferase n=1 Tax=Algicella marina TaxID=2683284 RepID=A0A6P1T2P5_9RHOB|nr:GNAT family N-acetyltransferase [Algicella marina]QHQ36001.1 GNAT family N-acetyltransferase [Algicella marina]
MKPEALATLHAQSFSTTPRPWNPDEFRDMLASDGVELLTEAEAFAVVRHAGPEFELLTLAVPPAQRRQGLAARLLAKLEALACERGASDIFLEVAETNTAARALYAGAGYLQTGRREAYFRDANGRPVAALVLCKPLT